jgi:hypothetical protein
LLTLQALIECGAALGRSFVAAIEIRELCSSLVAQTAILLPLLVDKPQR